MASWRAEVPGVAMRGNAGGFAVASMLGSPQFILNLQVQDVAGRALQG